MHSSSSQVSFSVGCCSSVPPQCLIGLKSSRTSSVFKYLITGEIITLLALYFGNSKHMQELRTFSFAGAMVAMLMACAVFILIWPLWLGWVVAVGLYRGLRT